MNDKEGLDDETPDFRQLFDMEKIQAIQDAFSNATGVASIITDINGAPLTRPSNFCEYCNIIRGTEKGLINCMKSDCLLGRLNREGPIFRPCFSGGLWDGGASIVVGDKHIANWLVGQVRDPEMNSEGLLVYGDKIGADRKKLESALNEITIMPPERFKNICHFLFLMANQLSELAYDYVIQKRINKEKDALQEKLNHKFKMDTLGQLASGIAHDFNNILGGILGASLYLKSIMENIEEEKEQFLDLIIETTERAAGLTDKLLSFSRKEDRDYNSVDLHRILEDTAILLERSIDKKIKLLLDTNARESHVWGSSSELQNCMINLGINSSHAMEENGGSLTIATSNETIVKKAHADNSLSLAPGEYIRLSVKDTGCGIPRENINRIFDPYFTTRRRGRGTGLGLPSVFSIIENHRGSITVESEEKRGTVFTIYLPVTPLKDKSSERKETADRLAQNSRIYFVDDEKPILSTYSKLLQQRGYHVTAFSNPLTALESFKKEFKKVDLVITDMQMPECSGKELFYRMKGLHSQCMVILTSGNIHEEDLNQMLDDGLSGFLKKPYTTKDLNDKISEVIGTIAPTTSHD